MMPGRGNPESDAPITAQALVKTSPNSIWFFSNLVGAEGSRIQGVQGPSVCRFSIKHKTFMSLFGSLVYQPDAKEPRVVGDIKQSHACAANWLIFHIHWRTLQKTFTRNSTFRDTLVFHWNP